MTIYSGIFNSINGDRKYNAWWFAKYFATFIGNGVFPNPSTGLQVMADERMQVKVRAGSGWIDGYFLYSDTNHVLKLDVSDGVLKRIDRIVMRLDYLTRKIDIVVKKGVPSSKPTAPTLQRDTDYVELALADVAITNGTTIITQADITDTRLNKTLCGIVHGTVNQVDTTTLFNQYQSWIIQQKDAYETDMATWTDTQKQAFELWFNTKEFEYDTWLDMTKDAIDSWINTTELDMQSWFDANKDYFVDWANIEKQYFSDWQSTERDNFYTWFDNLQAQLDSNVATNLQNQIDILAANTTKDIDCGRVSDTVPTGLDIDCGRVSTL